MRLLFTITEKLQNDYLSDDEQSVTTESSLLRDLFQEIYSVNSVFSLRHISMFEKHEEGFFLVLPEVFNEDSSLEGSLIMSPEVVC